MKDKWLNDCPKITGDIGIVADNNPSYIKPDNIHGYIGTVGGLKFDGVTYRGSITVTKDTKDFSELKDYLPIYRNNIFIVNTKDEFVKIGEMIFVSSNIMGLIPKKQITHVDDLIPENFECLDYFEREKFTFLQVLQYCNEMFSQFYELSKHLLSEEQEGYLPVAYRIKRKNDELDKAIVIHRDGHIDLNNRILSQEDVNACDWDYEPMELNNG